MVETMRVFWKLMLLTTLRFQCLRTSLGFDLILYHSYVLGYLYPGDTILLDMVGSQGSGLWKPKNFGLDLINRLVRQLGHFLFERLVFSFV